jgi:hypothetical protein
LAAPNGATTRPSVGHDHVSVTAAGAVGRGGAVDAGRGAVLRVDCGLGDDDARGVDGGGD